MEALTKVRFTDGLANFGHGLIAHSGRDVSQIGLSAMTSYRSRFARRSPSLEKCYYNFTLFTRGNGELAPEDRLPSSSVHSACTPRRINEAKNPVVPDTGLYNTVQEIIEAQRSNQLLRLSRIPTGRNLLQTLGCEPSGTIPNEEPLAAHIHLKPLPRNMNAHRYPGRRKARADYYARRYQNREDVLYADAPVGPPGRPRLLP
ncbi:hypothetical protein HPB49_001260 [Dermacentor silvarum]|uniref:Uncharacterized protein n=1 Tax=Dermacentor silvarum TaxID=543639 RepID=A0ACB8D9N7_DERSI|nr:hypothetical protein HPB49_001260 [Dermacentor silvarum]